jgi:DNA-binding NarL/FixJ family response regulator
VREGLATLINRERDLNASIVSTPLRDIWGSNEQETNPAVAIVAFDRAGALATAKHLKTKRPRLRIVVISTSREKAFAKEIFRTGAQGLLSINDTVDSVLVCIRKVLAGSAYFRGGFGTAVTGRAIRKKGKRDAREKLFPNFTGRELQVFRLLGMGKPTSQIASVLDISPKTVQEYFARMKRKMSVESYSDLLQAATRWDARRKK